jgi:hypothetical protein
MIAKKNKTFRSLNIPSAAPFLRHPAQNVPDPRPFDFYIWHFSPPAAIQRSVKIR